MTAQKNIERDVYASRVRPFISNRNAKVFTGIRRCGKSTLMDMTADEIASSNSDANIIRINMEVYSNRRLREADALYGRIKELLDGSRENFLFIDEIQDVPEWESVIRSLIAEKCCDIYITGSNSALLSSEYSTYLSGRINSIPVQPLTFRECVRFVKETGGDAGDAHAILDEYIRFGGFPDLWTSKRSESSAYSTLADIYSTIVLRDVASRYNIRSIASFEKVISFLCDNIGKVTSPFNIYNKMKEEKDPVDKTTVYAYLDHLEKSYFVRKAERYDIRGKKLLESRHKYYLSDIGLKHALLGYREEDIPGHIENIIFNELTARGYRAAVGDIDGKEVDFVAERMGRKLFIQAVHSLSSEDAVGREFGNLSRVDGGFPKFVVGMDPRWKTGDHVDGIRYRDLAEFLTADDW
ncbi:MAG: ATP-binding protein [Candidatus Methanoplasma sp.]|nr:ATP-binding protein [Candidatus Methanoplasma sp.]